MWLQIYSALLLDSSKGNWNICLSLGSCVRRIFFFLHRKQFLRKSFQFNLQIICFFVCLFFPQGKAAE